MCVCVFVKVLLIFPIRLFFFARIQWIKIIIIKIQHIQPVNNRFLSIMWYKKRNKKGLNMTMGWRWCKKRRITEQNNKYIVVVVVVWSREWKKRKKFLCNNIQFPQEKEEDIGRQQNIASRKHKRQYFLFY